MMTLAEVSARLSLEKLVTDYANAIDAREFARLDEVFTPDAYIDYRAMGGIDGRYPEIKAWLPQALAPFPAYMHFLGNFSCDVDGDVARGRTACLNPMEVPAPPDAGEGAQSEVMFLGLWYCDRFVRTNAGWRICERIEEKCYVHNMPAWMKQALKLK